MTRISLTRGTGTPGRALTSTLLLALASTLALTGCATGSGDSAHRGHGQTTAEGGSGTASSDGTPNAADEMFVTMMIPHHQQAIEMSELVLGKDGVDPAVAELAEHVQAAQQPEIDRMLGWLADWGISYDAESGAMDHGMGGGDGMMSADDLAALEAADGAAAGRLYLTQMIAHHEGAVEMAREAVAGASVPAVLELAQQVIDDQTAEIATMHDLLAGAE